MHIGWKRDCPALSTVKKGMAGIDFSANVRLLERPRQFATKFKTRIVLKCLCNEALEEKWRTTHEKT